MKMYHTVSEAMADYFPSDIVVLASSVAEARRKVITHFEKVWYGQGTDFYKRQRELLIRDLDDLIYATLTSARKEVPSGVVMIPGSS